MGKIAVSSPNFSLIEFELILKKISEHFNAWEIVAEGKHYLWDIKQEYISLMPSYNMEISAHAPLSDINIGSLNPTMRKESLSQIFDTIRIASELNIPLLIIHPGHYSPLGVIAKEEVKSICKESVKKIGKFCKDYGVRVALENMPKQDFTMCHTLEELTAISDGNVELCFDVGHANTAKCIDDFMNYTKGFADVHLHDNFGEKDEHLQIGRGKIEFKKILPALAKNHSGFFVIESRNLEEAVGSKKVLQKL